MQAIFNLDKPWAATEMKVAVNAELGGRAGEDRMHQEGHLLGSFRMGEERVRHIVLGSPLAAQLAATPPGWAR